MKKVIFRGIIFISLLSLGFSACDGCKSNSTGGQKIALSFDQFSGSGDNEVYLKRMIDLYTTANPNVSIRLQSYGFEDYFMQLAAKVSTGRAPDVYELNYENFVAYAKNGSLFPLDDLIASGDIDASIYNKMALAAFSANGNQYGLPNCFSNVVLIYNKNLFDRAGISYPTDDWTWTDAMLAAKAIRALGSGIFGYYQPLSFTEFYKTAAQNNGGFLSVDGKRFTINSPANVETVAYLVDMQRGSNVMPTPEQLGGMEDWDLFKAGRLGMIVTGIWAFPDFTRDCDFAWDIAVEPGNKQKATHFFSNGYVINKNSPAAVEAAKFIAFISSNPGAVKIRLDAAWELPPVVDSNIIAQYKAKTTPANREAVFKSLDYLVTPPVITQFSQLQDIVAKHLSEAASGSVSPVRALTNMEAELTRTIDLGGKQ